MLIFALIAGVLGTSSVLFGFVHVRTWTSESLAVAATLAATSWAITALAFGLAVKEIVLGGHRGKRLQTLEAFLFISVLSQLFYLGILLLGLLRRFCSPN